MNRQRLNNNNNNNNNNRSSFNMATTERRVTVIQHKAMLVLAFSLLISSGHCFFPSLNTISISPLSSKYINSNRKGYSSSSTSSLSFPKSIYNTFSSYSSFSLTNPSLLLSSSSRRRTTANSYFIMMASVVPERNGFNQDFTSPDIDSWSKAKEFSIDRFQKATPITKNNNNNSNKRKVRKKYKRKIIPATEKAYKLLRKERQEKYDQMRSNTQEGEAPSIWSFEGLFPKPVWDEDSVKRDLYSVRQRDADTENNRKRNSLLSTLSTKKMQRSTSVADKDETTNNEIVNGNGSSSTKIPANATTTSITKLKMKTSSIGGSSMMRVWRDPKLSSFVLPYDPPPTAQKAVIPKPETKEEKATTQEKEIQMERSISEQLAAAALNSTSSGKVDLKLSRMVEDKLYGYRRDTNTYDTSLMGDGAIQFRDGVRLGNPLRINADRLNYHAKRELRHDRVEEAQELYEIAVKMDPRDGRAYLGLSRCAERRRDFKLARAFLRAGIDNSVSTGPNGVPDRGANPFLLQALGVMEEKAGNLSKAEGLYLAAVKSRPSHAAAWVALAQLRTRKLRQGASAGRVCYRMAERELQKAGEPQSSHVYTAWASLEYKKAGDIFRARDLFKQALAIDPKCSAAWMQLGVMEAENENWDRARECFETVLKFDQRNSRVLQAYAIMESKRPDGSSRKAIELFEKAQKANSRDAGALQAYALYVLKLGDVDAARKLLKRGTEVNKRHAPVWQAWGVLETRYGTTDDARDIFQQGIWSCAQLSGNQSGGHECARLWQAWGVLEAREGEYAAARRCFSRALDADKRNVAAVTAWTQMEEMIGNIKDAELIFERSLKDFAPGTKEKAQIWRSYELMQSRAGNDALAQEVYQRSMRETLGLQEEPIEVGDIESGGSSRNSSNGTATNGTNKQGLSSTMTKPKVKEVSSEEYEEVVDVWMNKGNVEGKVPKAAMKRRKR